MQCLPILFYQYSIRAHARVHVYMLYLFVKSVSCFIFMFQLIENQTFQEMKDWHSMFHFWFQCFIFYLPHPFPKKHTRRKIKPQWERFKTSMGEKSNPNGRNTTETLKSKMKHRMPMFQALKVLIINALCYENETWNKKTSQGKYYVRARKATRPHLGATRPRVGICLSRLDALTSKYNTFSYCQVGVSNPNLAMPTRGRVAPR